MLQKIALRLVVRDAARLRVVPGWTHDVSPQARRVAALHRLAGDGHRPNRETGRDRPQGNRNKAIEIVRRQPDGTWKLLVGDPDGRESAAQRGERQKRCEQIQEDVMTITPAIREL